jgi:hypothetical protein
MSRDVIIDNMTIRLPNGWSGDAVHLARRIAEQLQQQASELSSTKEISITVKEHFGGSANSVVDRIAPELKAGIERNRRNRR